MEPVNTPPTWLALVAVLAASNVHFQPLTTDGFCLSHSHPLRALRFGAAEVRETNGKWWVFSRSPRMQREGKR